jgi:hypothetical protein
MQIGYLGSKSPEVEYFLQKFWGVYRHSWLAHYLWREIPWDGNN